MAALHFDDSFPPGAEAVARAARLSPLPVPAGVNYQPLLASLIWLWRLLVKGGAE
jgi:hypothetical protein